MYRHVQICAFEHVMLTRKGFCNPGGKPKITYVLVRFFLQLKGKCTNFKCGEYSCVCEKVENPVVVPEEAALNLINCLK